MVDNQQTTQAGTERPPLLPGNADSTVAPPTAVSKASPETISEIIHTLADRADPLIRITTQLFIPVGCQEQIQSPSVKPSVKRRSQCWPGQCNRNACRNSFANMG